MRKIVVFDSGFGGDLFADYLKEEVPVLEIARVIDWRNSDKFIKSKNDARKAARLALQPYIGKADVIFFANYLLSITSLRYFRRKYKNQQFAGFSFNKPNRIRAKTALILTTKALDKTFTLHLFNYRLGLDTKILDCDHWVQLIDDGELTEDRIRQDLANLQDFHPQLIILGCTQFADIKPALRDIFGSRIIIEDGYNSAIRNLCKELKLRGLAGKLK